MKRVMIPVILTACLFLGACSDPKIDATNENTLKASREKIEKSLTVEQKKQLDEAFDGIAGEVVAKMLVKAFSGQSVSEVDTFKEMKQKLDKKTAKQIIAEFEKVKKAEAERKEKEEKEKLEREKQEALEKIKALEAKKEAAEKASEELKKIAMTNAKFYMDDSNPYMSQPVIEFDVQNNTEKTIAGVFAKGIIKDPKREVPFFEETFAFKISGGLQKGEKKHMGLEPNSFSSWGRANNPKGAVFYVIPLYAKDANDNILWNALFSDGEVKELAELKAKYSN